MPMALESFDLRGYDLIVSSESGPAKGVITSSNTHHVCYCHTPMRYLWDLYPAYRNEWTHSRLKARHDDAACQLPAPLGFCFGRARRPLRRQQPQRAARIWKTYRRETDVIHPPVDVDSFYSGPSDDYFLAVSELVPYKRIDLLVR